MAQKLHNGIFYKGILGPRADSIFCPVRQNFLGKCVPQIHFPGGQVFL